MCEAPGPLPPSFGLPKSSLLAGRRKGYAVDGIKHCIRVADMGGKSGVVLLRKIHPHLIKEVIDRSLPPPCSAFSPSLVYDKTAQAKTMQRNQSLKRWLGSLDLEDPQQYVDSLVRHASHPPALGFLSHALSHRLPVRS